jgi:hypothetical protein
MRQRYISEQALVPHELRFRSRYWDCKARRNAQRIGTLRSAYPDTLGVTIECWPFSRPKLLSLQPPNGDT